MITHLEDHPNLDEVLGVLAQLPQISDAELSRLASAWRHDGRIADARDRALSLDSPLVCEVLAAFDALESLFNDELHGEAEYVTLSVETATMGLKAVRDAIAAVYARPILSSRQYDALLAPWKSVYPRATAFEPELGERGAELKALLMAMGRLASRCHAPASAELFERLSVAAWMDESEREERRKESFAAAVSHNKRRLWALVRRSGAESMLRPCPVCRTSQQVDWETERVLELCLDAACALLVSAEAPAEATRLLVAPVQSVLALTV